MAHLNVGRGSARSAKLAIDLAGRFDAALLGVCAALPPDMPLAEKNLSEIASKNAAATHLVHRMAETEVAFRKAASNVPHVFWRESFDLPTSALLREARAADLIVVGRDNEPTTASAIPLDIGALVVQAGRAILVVPPGIDYLPASRILIGWKDTREARRAVRESIPFLKFAKEVILVESCEKGSENAALDRLADVESYLGRHGVEPCTKYYIHDKAETADELVRVAQDEGAGLIVTGAYGHTRVGEWAFGGVTRDLLSSSPLCCLLSH